MAAVGNPKSSWLNRLVRWWAGRPGIDIAVTLVTCVVVDQAMSKPPGTPETRQAALQAMIGLCVGAVAFGVTGTSVLLAVPPGRRLQKLLETAGYDLTRLVMIAVGTLTAAAIALNWAIVYESPSPGWLLPTIELAFCLVGVLSQARLVWIFFQIFILLAIERPGAEQS